MIEVINQIKDFGLTNVVICGILICLLVVGAISLRDEIFEKLDIKTGKSIRDNKLNERLNNMEQQLLVFNTKISCIQDEFSQKQNEYHQESIEIRNELGEQLKELMEKMTAFMVREDETTVALFRSSLWRMHKDFVSQGFVTPDGLKTFIEMGKIYELCHGDDIYHEKLLPEVESLEIHYPDGSIYGR